MDFISCGACCLRRSMKSAANVVPGSVADNQGAVEDVWTADASM